MFLRVKQFSRDELFVIYDCLQANTEILYANILYFKKTIVFCNNNIYF